jgi:RimJ/RimL family protein N-acetyltransferase
VPSMDTFQQGMTSGILTQFVVQGRRDETILGHVIAYGADLNSGYAYIGGVMDPRSVRTGFGIEAFEVFVDYLFATYALRKIYLEVPEYNMEQFSNGYRSILREEARLKDHSIYDSILWDRITLALYREDYRSDARVNRRRRSRLLNGS